MAASELVVLADEVVEALNAHTFAVSLKAARLYVPVYKLTDLGTLRVTAVPRALAGTVIDRGRTREMAYEVDVGFQQRVQAPVDAASQAALDDLTGLVESVADYLLATDFDLDTGRKATALGVVNDPPYDPIRLDQMGEFLSVVTVTYRVYR
jgi:hypothetical protein